MKAGSLVFKIFVSHVQAGRGMLGNAVNFCISETSVATFLTKQQQCFEPLLHTSADGETLPQSTLKSALPLKGVWIDRT